MKIINTKKEIKNQLKLLKQKNNIIGLVPTMGYLHEGHTSLIKKARKECDIVFLSIFVNPTQFGPNEDFNDYPRDLKRDLMIADKNGVDLVFIPSTKEMYPSEHKTFVDIVEIGDIMCGKSRKGHFRGVCTVVLKLFNILEPNIAYFGYKDFQQMAIIKKMVKDLDINILIKPIKTVREKDGLALSSRNKYLQNGQRKDATILYQTLLSAKKDIMESKKSVSKIKEESVKKIITKKNVKKVDYFDIRNAETLKEIKSFKKGETILIATAAFLGKTRLIDNIFFKY